jgi:hypothetical protein
MKLHFGALHQATINWLAVFILEPTTLAVTSHRGAKTADKCESMVEIYKSSTWSSSGFFLAIVV